ncbi:CBS domain-containing protein [Sporosarcina aquimarina]|uniref:CBS domain-containing protein n=1 Tax=Sporosarcina aquimarina TaxID=114975 RepID=A0ABU4FYS3_9BACL|nr:CBS domain-containing protein [Sporosarcina aquimarina]MDW0109873.1 CBS domain-containing protein [Sporosarcina aquimarina]
MSAKNSDRFIIAYNRIEKTLSKKVDESGFLPFYRLIEKAKVKNSVVRNYEEDLREFGDLRNAIVHHRTGLDYVIAEPHDDIVELIELIERKVSNPLNVGALFGCKVHTLKASDPLTTALRLMQHNKFGQVPIYENDKFKGLITAAGITHWLAGQSTEKTISREIPTLSDVYNYEKRKESFEFVKKDLSVYEAEDYFKRAISKGTRLEALLITENAGHNEELIGIITPYDLLKID